MKNCKDHLSYDDNAKELDDIALPFFERLKGYTVKPPSIGYFLKKLFQSLTIVTFIFRCIDAVTDITLTTTYLTSWDQVVKDYMNQIPSSQNVSSSNCSTEKIVCMIPNLEMKWKWIPGMLSAIILLITWVAEGATIIRGLYKNKPHFIHYCEVFSRACCKKHLPKLVYASGIILPLTNQIFSIIYEHWMRTFVLYWKEKSQHLANFNLESETNCKCSENCNKNEVCVYCSKNVKFDTGALDKLKLYADEVSASSRKLVAKTENLFMPMIQFAFLFPSILVHFYETTGEAKLGKTSDEADNTPVGWLKYVSDNWTTVLIVSSTVSSIASLAASQSAIYFSAPGNN